MNLPAFQLENVEADNLLAPEQVDVFAQKPITPESPQPVLRSSVSNFSQQLASALSNEAGIFKLRIMSSIGVGGVQRLYLADQDRPNRYLEELPSALAALIRSEHSAEINKAEGAAFDIVLSAKAKAVLIAESASFEGYKGEEAEDIKAALIKGEVPHDPKGKPAQFHHAALALLSCGAPLVFRPATDRAHYDALYAERAGRVDIPPALIYTPSADERGTNNPSVFRLATVYMLLKQQGLSFESVGFTIDPGKILNRLERLYGHAKNWSMLRHNQAFTVLKYANNILEHSGHSKGTKYRVLNIDRHTDLKFGITRDPEGTLRLGAREGDYGFVGSSAILDWVQRSVFSQHQTKDAVIWMPLDMVASPYIFFAVEGAIAAPDFDIERAFEQGFLTTTDGFPKTSLFAVSKSDGSAYAFAEREPGTFTEEDYRIVPLHKVSEAANYSVEDWENYIKNTPGYLEKLKSFDPERLKPDFPGTEDLPKLAEYLMRLMQSRYHPPAFLAEDDSALMVSTDLDFFSSQGTRTEGGTKLLGLLDSMLEMRLKPLLNADCYSPSYVSTQDAVMIGLYQSMYQVYSGNDLFINAAEAQGLDSDYVRSAALQEALFPAQSLIHQNYESSGANFVIPYSIEHDPEFLEQVQTLAQSMFGGIPASLEEYKDINYRDYAIADKTVLEFLDEAGPYHSQVEFVGQKTVRGGWYLHHNDEAKGVDPRIERSGDSYTIFNTPGTKNKIALTHEQSRELVQQIKEDMVEFENMPGVFLSDNVFQRLQLGIELRLIRATWSQHPDKRTVVCPDGSTFRIDLSTQEVLGQLGRDNHSPLSREDGNNVNAGIRYLSKEEIEARLVAMMDEVGVPNEDAQ